MKTKINEFAVVMVLIIKKKSNIKINELFFNNHERKLLILYRQKIDALL